MTARVEHYGLAYRAQNDLVDTALPILTQGVQDGHRLVVILPRTLAGALRTALHDALGHNGPALYPPPSALGGDLAGCCTACTR